MSKWCRNIMRKQRNSKVIPYRCFFQNHHLSSVVHPTSKPPSSGSIHWQVPLASLKAWQLMRIGNEVHHGDMSFFMAWQPPIGKIVCFKLLISEVEASRRMTKISIKRRIRAELSRSCLQATRPKVGPTAKLSLLSLGWPFRESFLLSLPCFWGSVDLLFCSVGSAGSRGLQRLRTDQKLNSESLWSIICHLQFMFGMMGLVLRLLLVDLSLKYTTWKSEIGWWSVCLFRGQRLFFPLSPRGPKICTAVELMACKHRGGLRVSQAKGSESWRLKVGLESSVNFMSGGCAENYHDFFWRSICPSVFFLPDHNFRKPFKVAILKGGIRLWPMSCTVFTWIPINTDFRKPFLRVIRFYGPLSTYLNIISWAIHSPSRMLLGMVFGQVARLALEEYPRCIIIVNLKRKKHV